jgi:hypothetical protein
MKLIVAQPIEGRKIKGTNPFRLYTKEEGYFDFLPTGKYAIPGELADIDGEDMRIISYVVVDSNGDCPSMLENRVPHDEIWFCSRRSAILANWI